MTLFDPTQQAQIERSIKQLVDRPQIGRVTQVYEHITDDDKSNFEVDVELISTTAEGPRDVPWQQPQSGEIKVPKVGDKVIVEYRGGSNKSAIARNAVNTNEDRPPKGRAGMWRKTVDGGSTPAGDGDLYIESHTAYDTNPASPEFNQSEASVNNSYIRLAKKADDTDSPVDGDTIPMMVEMFDDAENDEAHIKIELNKVDGSDTVNTWGLKFDLKTGQFKILDGSGYGIESDGAGNFIWHSEDIVYSDGTTTSL